MTAPLPGRPIRSNAAQKLEKFHVDILLVLGIAFIGAGVTAIGFATASPGAVGLGAAAVVASGLIAVYFALAGVSRMAIEEESDPSDAPSIAPLAHDSETENRRPVWPPRTSSQ
jgi:hypothetical protein